MIQNKFDWKPFSHKQLKIMTWWCGASPYKDYDGVIADGAVRSGKTISMGASFVVWAMEKYARYHWYGKLMVDPKTGKGAFYNPKTGRYWSRPKTSKKLTGKDLKYKDAPIRGSRWVERAWIDHGEKVIERVEKYANGGGTA